MPSDMVNEGTIRAAAVLLAAILAAGCGARDEGAMPDLAVAACAPAAGSVRIDAGSYMLGEDRFYPEEGPVREVAVGAFEIDRTEVTNAQFAEFVAATGYVTRAERGLAEPAFDHLPDEMRRPGSAVFQKPLSSVNLNLASWWKFMEGASWRAPEGEGSSIDGREDHPVVHIALEDAEAYAKWRGRRLPSEAEWEVAARGGLDRAKYAWGDAPPGKSDKPMANTWQGVFPVLNQETDGYAGSAPVGCFPPNGYGLFDMTGNAWEWTSDPYYPRRGRAGEGAGGEDPNQPGVPVGVIKGGSFLCAENYCVRFRPAARQGQDLTFSASHIGFRTAKDVR